MSASVLDTSLAKLSGVGERLRSKLERLGLHTVRDLLYHFPARYEDYSELVAVADLAPGMHATITAEVRRIEARHSWRKRLSITEAVLADESGSVRAVWFNQPYMATSLPVGTRGSFAGKVTTRDGEISLSNPTFERTSTQGAPTKHTARLVPVYPETKGLTSKWLRHLILPILEQLPQLPDPLPEDVRAANRYPELTAALRTIHFPADRGLADRARERFVFEELLILQLYTLLERQTLAKENAPPLVLKPETMKRWLAALPFTLTAAQKAALWEIMQDMGEERPMNRLLQGDVGSGKTIVAILASLIAHGNGYQTAFMAPTEVLARQHFRTYQQLLPRLSKLIDMPGIGLIARGGAEVLRPDGTVAKLTARKLRTELAEQRISICIGTHALLHGEETFAELGLVVIDEQHRFGVKQRQRLVRRGGELPHFLSMSATPIPRTIMMTVFGDLTTSRITELPKDRKEIVTKVVGRDDRTKTYGFIREQIKAGRQAFVICPRIDPPQPDEHGAQAVPLAPQLVKKLDARSVKEEHERLRSKIFPKLRIGMLHGAMPAREKESVMQQFRDGALDILVATSVIEVGIDVPNATVMLIENADHFGLAQLYQFRGRVGRGEHQSYCFLLSDAPTKSAEARLHAIVTAKNGFELAEQDLKLRGPGEFLGDAQTGVPDLAMQYLSNEPLVSKSRSAALSLLKTDPSLQKHPLLREQLATFRTRVHRE
jgi:ATP-dependent DNA helicase RecG